MVAGKSTIARTTDKWPLLLNGQIPRSSQKYSQKYCKRSPIMLSGSVFNIRLFKIQADEKLNEILIICKITITRVSKDHYGTQHEVLDVTQMQSHTEHSHSNFPILRTYHRRMTLTIPPPPRWSEWRGFARPCLDGQNLAQCFLEPARSCQDANSFLFRRHSYKGSRVRLRWRKSVTLLVFYTSGF